MLPRMLVLAATLLVCLGSSRQDRGPGAGGPRQPVNDPAVCRASCQRYLGCKGVADPARESDCTRACAEGQVSGDLAYQISVSECADVIALAEGAIPVPPPEGGPAEAAPSEPPMAQVPTVEPTCGAPAAGGDPALAKLLAGRVWCAAASPDGARRPERVTFHATGAAMISEVAMMTALGPTPTSAPVSACWRLEGTTLSVSRDGAAFAPVPIKVAKAGTRSKLMVGSRSYDDCTDLP